MTADPARVQRVLEWTARNPELNFQMSLARSLKAVITYALSNDSNETHRDEPDVLNDADALELARDWVAKRTKVRKRLIAMAREANPINAPRPQELYASAFPDNNVRKLWQYPHDLSEERLLALIENGGTK